MTYIHMHPQTHVGLRIGDRVRSLVDDVNVTIGLEGVIVNIATPQPRKPARARITWDNSTISLADADTFVVVPKDAA